MKTTRVLLGAALLALAPPAAADDLANSEGSQRMAEGKKLYADGQYEAAWLKYVQACVVVRTEACTRGLAFTAHKSGRYLAAHGYIKQLLEPAPRPSLTPAMINELVRMRDDAYRHIGHVEVTAPPGTMVMLDQEAVGRAPIAEALDVDAGGHTVEAIFGGRTSSQRIEATAGEVIKVRFEEAVPVAVAPAVGWAPVDAAQAPAPGPAGAPSAETTGAEVSIERPGATRLWMTVGLGAGAVALAAGALYFGLRSRSAADDATAVRSGLADGACRDPSAPGCAALSGSVHAENRDHTASVVMYGAAGALAAGALLSWVLLPSGTGSSASASASASPMLGPGVVGGRWSTTF